MSATRRHELGVTMIVHRLPRWSEIVAVGDYTDRASVFDHTAFSEPWCARELRNALRRHARAVKRQASDR